MRKQKGFETSEYKQFTFVKINLTLKVFLIKNIKNHKYPIYKELNDYLWFYWIPHLN